ncbi:MAG: hypothetical protein QOF80_296, partial [Verrucomicrobiota bacterium]
SGQTRHQFLGCALRADGPIAHPGEMLDQEIDDAITEPAHFIARKLEARRDWMFAHASVVAGIGDPGKCELFPAGISDPGYSYGLKSIVSPEPSIVTDILE